MPAMLAAGATLFDKMTVNFGKDLSKKQAAQAKAALPDIQKAISEKLTHMPNKVGSMELVDTLTLSAGKHGGIKVKATGAAFSRLGNDMDVTLKARLSHDGKLKIKNVKSEVDPLSE